MEWTYSFTRLNLSSVDGGEWSLLLPSRCYPWVEPPFPIGLFWVGPRAYLDSVEKRRISAPAGNGTPIPRTSSP
jgi:hypothetical protein